MKNTAAFLRSLTLSLSIAALGSVATTSVYAQAQGQTQQAPQPCSTTTTNPSSNSSASNPAAALKSLGSLFKKKPSSQPSSANANPAPCAPAATTPAAPGNKNAGQPAGGSQGAGINLNGPFTPPADVKIDVAQFGSLPQGTPYYVSPHGAHVAIQAHAGSRVQMIYDGVAGPVFDSFTGLGGASLWFSPDGNHYGYCGVSSDHFTVIVDGKVVGTSSEMNVSGFDCQVLFSPNSKHFYYISHVGPDNGHVHARLVIDGKQEVDFGDINRQNLIFSPDGEHFAAYLYAYPGRTMPNGTGAMELVVDGKISSWPGNSPVWSADSRHLFTVGQAGQNQILYRDGEQLLSANNIILAATPIDIGVTAPPAGDAPVAIAHSTNRAAGGVLKEQWYLAMNGKQIPGTLLEKTGGGGAAQIMNLFVSRDGKHYAAIVRGANGKQYLFSDGKRGEDYYTINPTTVQFTSGTFEPIYVAVNANVQYLIVGTQETAIPSINSIIVSPAGDHVATEGFGGFLDGQPLNLSGGNPATTQVHAFSFSPDGKNYAYVVLGKGGGLTLYVNGIPDTAHSWDAPATSDKVPLWMQGSNIVYICGPTNPATGNQIGLCFDGKYGYLAPRPVFSNLALTPDASHIYFTEGISQGGFRLFVDGAPLLEGFSLSGFSPGTWEVEPNGALHVLTQDNTGIKRYTITPGTSTSLAALVGGTTTAAAANH